MDDEEGHDGDGNEHEGAQRERQRFQHHGRGGEIDIGVGEELAAQRKELDRLAGRTNSLADFARSAAAGFSSRRSYFPDGFRLGDIVSSLLDGDRDTDEALQEALLSLERECERARTEADRERLHRSREFARTALQLGRLALG